MQFWGLDKLPGGGDISALENKVNSLSQIAAKTNITNTFTQNQIFNGWLLTHNGFYNQNGSALTVAKLKNQGEKHLDLLFEQNEPGYRNYCNFGIKHKYGNQNDSQAAILFNIESRNTNEGLFITADSNKIQFTSLTTLDNVGTPTTANMAANKSYVDSSHNYVEVLNNREQINQNTTKTYTMSQNIKTGVNSFIITFPVSNVDISFEWNVYVNSTTYTNMSNVFTITDSTNDITPKMEVIFWVDNNNRFNLRTGAGFNLTNGLRVYKRG